MTSDCVGCFAGLSCQTRLEIINLLKKKSKLSVLEIAQQFAVTQPTITHHLKYLEELEILTSKREGRKIYYSLHPKCKEDTCQIFS